MGGGFTICDLSIRMFDPSSVGWKQLEVSDDYWPINLILVLHLPLVSGNLLRLHLSRVNVLGENGHFPEVSYDLHFPVCHLSCSHSPVNGLCRPCWKSFQLPLLLGGSNEQPKTSQSRSKPTATKATWTPRPNKGGWTQVALWRRWISPWMARRSTHRHRQ